VSSGTPIRTVRVDDGLWEEAQAAASERGENLSDVIREALRQYVSNHVNESVKPCPSL
jgi:antitoxin component of RelBE/YafQ-DinJ toxin-antitoxin module